MPNLKIIYIERIYKLVRMNYPDGTLSVIDSVLRPGQLNVLPSIDYKQSSIEIVINLIIGFIYYT